MEGYSMSRKIANYLLIDTYFANKNCPPKQKKEQ